ncbi:hypothetical protein WR25_07778 [Diploscapter pachys]|uniref:GRAM domain-containing protein n=1 Tax=Diploscapter pachys TaxID=2018661 RepID=A0A2A2JPL8_9BILA|nr:hypothetical protein WR25_07778 [Diploscapter pachys]
MSVNTANTPDGRGVLLFNGEVIVIYTQGVVMTIGKSNNQGLEGRRNGTIYLTSHRIIFMPDEEEANWVRSFEMPFNTMQDVHLDQPIFGANYLRGIALAMPGSLLSGEIPWRMTFNKGGCIDFGHALLQAVERAAEMRPANAPPPYVPPQGDFYAAPPDYYQPRTNPDYNPTTDAFPDRPNPERVFLMEAPPPYPGVGVERPPQPTEELVRAGANAPPPPYGIAPEASEGVRRRN